jgi:Na+-transporting NADH:ubiquinone oxidoreductase subunit C
MKGNLYTVIFAAILGVTCSFLLTAVAQITKEKADANKSAEEKRNIFTALNVPFDKKAPSEQLEQIYAEKITESDFADDMKIYAYASPEGKAYAVRIEGPGLWGPIKGFLALEADMETIRGITFYEQEETPGLGAEISTPQFQSQFKGKKIYDQMDKPGIVIKGGKNPNPINEVDAISGATITSRKVQQLINVSVKKIAEVNNGN